MFTSIWASKISMITRRVPTCLRLVKNHSRISKSRSNGWSDSRFASTSANPAPVTSSQSTASQLAVITNELDKLTPRFEVSAESIEILRSPSEFYTALKTRIRNAKRRIFLSTLYIGKSEHELIDTVREALKANSNLHVSFLTDYLRGTREAPDASCASLLAALVREFGAERVEVRMYHTPNLTGRRKALVPKRINEGWGLQHMKLYGVDDDIIMSGANLSNDYFTNRQDRYHVLKSGDVTEYFATLHRTVCDMSYQVIPSDKEASGFEMQWPNSNLQPAPLDDPKRYIEAATKAITTTVQSKRQQSLAPESSSDTFIYPLLQLTPLLKPDTSSELPAVTSILRTLGTPDFAGSKWMFTAGYFNMTPEFRQLLLATNPSSATVVAASPWANGFYGSKGVSGMLPAAYTLLSRRFLASVAKLGLEQRITLKEWRFGTVNTPGGWTYHAKGLWVTLPGQSDPCISLVGSSNYTKRSYALDLEANTLIVTRNADLQRRLGEEQAWLQEHATPMTRDDYTRTERRVGLHVRLAMWLVTALGGAL